jgi:hypothetical protein
MRGLILGHPEPEIAKFWKNFFWIIREMRGLILGHLMQEIPKFRKNSQVRVETVQDPE